MSSLFRALRAFRFIVAITWAISLAVSPIHAQDLLPDAATDRAQKRAPSVGVQVKIETFTGQDARAISRTGFDFIRFGVWTERLDDEAYARRVGSAFAIAARAQLPVLLTMRSTVPLSTGGDEEVAQLESTGRQFGARVGALAHQYSEQLIGIELWNEPDLGRYWPTGRAIETFPLFMRGVCAQLKRSPLPVPVYGFGFSRAPVGDTVASRLLHTVLFGSSHCVEAVSYHAYGMTPGQIRDAAREVRAMYGLPTIITEWGAPSQGSTTSSPAMQGRRIGAFVATIDALNVPLVSIYEWKDTERAANPQERSFGLVDSDSVTKPALESMVDYFGKRPGTR